MTSSLSREEDHHVDGRRAREVYRYFQPERSFFSDRLSTPSGGDSDSLQQLGSNVREPMAAGPASPALSTQPAAALLPEALILGEYNATLESFAQLAALRLDVERVLISISDRSSHFIIAQSTKYLPGKGQECEIQERGTWGRCHSLSSSAWTICKKTIDLPPSNKERGEHHFFEFNDLSQDDRYKSLPFVQNTKPRNGLTRGEQEVLSSLSILIMDFLKVGRQASEGRRAARLSRGLSCFVEGSSSFVESVHTSSAGSLFWGDAGRSSSPPTVLPEWWSGAQRKELRGLDQSHGNCWAFRRAANPLRESLELDGNGGVVFLEVSNAPATDIDSGSDFLAKNMNPTSILAMSTNEEPFAPGPGSTVVSPAANLDTGFLQQLLRRYTRGKLWSFYRDGSVSGSDDESTQYPEERTRNTKPLELPKGGPKRWRFVENSLLNTYFPNATQVMFVPLWNAASSLWFAGCFCWTTLETRVFSPSVELSSLLGFGSSIMVEHSRLESLISDRQKGDFIGSISHELRSPLHGILAAAEFLSGTNLDEFQGSLLETVNACGKTLLDTMNQVLDFSKIVSLERKFRQLKQRNKDSPLEMDDKISAGLDTIVPTDLALLTEEVVDGVCLGHAYSQNPVNQSGCHCETYYTQPGALRRIIMNVFGNAMKYTEAGRVSIRLEVSESSDGCSDQPAEDLVTLTVSNTGKGISEEFLRGRLYTPFCQEDTLAVGTGLGLSIVRSLVNRPGKGTVVKVTLPLTRPGDVVKLIAPFTTDAQSVHSAADIPIISDLDWLRDSHTKKRAAIFGLDLSDIATHPMWSTVSRYLTDWYGLELVSWLSDPPVDILLADEDLLAGHTSAIRDTTPLPPLIVICSRSIDYSTARSQWASLGDIVSIITHPCGPHKLARTIRKCFESQNGTIPNHCQLDLPERPLRKKLAPLFEAIVIPEGQEKPFEDVGDTPDLTGATNSTVSGSIRSTPLSQTSSENNDPLSVLAPASPVQLPHLTEPPAAGKQRSPRVLVVDDNSINLSLMLTFMKKRHLSTLESAENGQLAVNAVERTPGGYDLIFIDISMPERDSEHSTIATIIALTGLSSARDESEALASVIDLFLTKPVSFKEVSKLLDEWRQKTFNC
ncbi:hypothetical protein BJX70DRAFT_391134 [Aspergillus crustosus]